MIRDGSDSASSQVRRILAQAIDGPELVVDDAGPLEAPAVVLMHGGGQTRHSWSAAMNALVAHGFRVMNFDARGHGDSGWAPDGAYDLDDRADDLRAVVSSIAGPFVLVGASLGGATAIHAVAQGMDPAAVVLVDVVPTPEAEGIERIVSFMRGNADGFGNLDEAVDAVMAYNPRRARPGDPSGLMRNLRPRPDGRLRWHWDPRIAEGEPAHHHAIVQRSAIEMAQRTSMPVLLVRGSRSDVVSGAGVEAFQRVVPRLEVVDVAEAGHMVAGDQNDAFNAAVIAFISRHLPLSGTPA